MLLPYYIDSFLSPLDNKGAFSSGSYFFLAIASSINSISLKPVTSFLYYYIKILLINFINDY